jgi:hypothetical protein
MALRNKVKRIIIMILDFIGLKAIAFRNITEFLGNHFND